jgi:hypothetical protein
MAFKAAGKSNLWCAVWTMTNIPDLHGADSLW